MEVKLKKDMQKIDIQDYEKKIRSLQKELEKFRPIPEVQLKNLQNWFNIWFTTHSNAIEGNSYTLSEVKVLIEDGITVWGKTIRETKETENLAEITQSLWSFFEQDFLLTEKFLYDMHRKLLKGIEKKYIGKYRDSQVFITGSEDIPPSSKELPKLMQEFIYFCNSETSKKDCLKKISDIHFRFIKIHPFFDGNGRIWRLLMNLFLVKYWYFPIIFPIVTRIEYIQSLWKEKNSEDFYKYFLWQMYENISDYLRFFQD